MGTNLTYLHKLNFITTKTLLHVTCTESANSTMCAKWRHILINDVFIYRIGCYLGIRYYEQLPRSILSIKINIDKLENIMEQSI